MNEDRSKRTTMKSHPPTRALAALLFLGLTLTWGCFGSSSGDDDDECTEDYDCQQSGETEAVCSDGVCHSTDPGCDESRCDPGCIDGCPTDECDLTNECGGCGVLGGAVGDACGTCSLGAYLCTGADALICDGALTGDEDGDGVCAPDDRCPEDNPDDPDGDGFCGTPVDLSIEYVDDSAEARTGLDGEGEAWFLGNLFEIDDPLDGELEGKRVVNLSRIAFHVETDYICDFEMRFYIADDEASLGSRAAVRTYTISSPEAGWVYMGDEDFQLPASGVVLFGIRPLRADCVASLDYHVSAGPNRLVPFGTFIRSGRWTDAANATDFPMGGGEVYTSTYQSRPVSMRFDIYSF